MVGELTAKGALFLTASDAVSWFRKRRSVIFDRAGSARVQSDGETEAGLRLRVYRPERVAETIEDVERMPVSFTETTFTKVTNFRKATDEVTPLRIGADG